MNPLRAPRDRECAAHKKGALYNCCQCAIEGRAGDGLSLARILLLPPRHRHVSVPVASLPMAGGINSVVYMFANNPVVLVGSLGLRSARWTYSGIKQSRQRLVVQSALDTNGLDVNYNVH